MAQFRPAFRLALLLAGKERCVWCRKPITFREMEVEHLIPESVTREELAGLIALHGLSGDYDIHATRNLAPSCRDCNGEKSDRLLPDAPMMTFLLASSAERAPMVESEAARFESRRELHKALAIVMASADSYVTEETLAAVSDANAVLESMLGRPLRLHPALGLLWDPERWRVAQVLGPDVIVVEDAQNQGKTGTHASYRCSACGSHGPWDGIICRTCGNREVPD